MEKDTVRTEAQKRASKKWEDKFKQRVIRIPFSKDKKLVDYCKKKNESINGLINKLIEKELNNK